MKRLILAAGLLSAFLLGGTSGCVAPGPQTVEVQDQSGSSVATRYAMSQFLKRMSVASAEYFDSALVERLPNVLFSVDGGEAHRVGKGIVVGDVVSVEPGKGYVMDSEEAVAGTPVEFDNAKALWRTMVVKVAVTESWGADAAEVSFGLAFDGKADPEEMLRGVRELGRVVVGLGAQGRYHDKSLYSVARNGSLIGQVDSDGRISLPIVGELEEAYLKDAATVGALQGASKEPRKIIEIVEGKRKKR